MRVLIVGAGGHGRVVLDIMRQTPQLVPAGFLDSDKGRTGEIMDGTEILGTPDEFERLAVQHSIDGAIIAIGDNATRARFAKHMRRHLPLVSIIHPMASVANTVEIGDNCVIAAGAMVCAHVVVGDSVILNTGCIVDHECIVAGAAHICPGVRLAGRVKVGRGAFVGIGATVIQGISIGPRATVGAGAVVIQDVPASTTAVGVPARFIARAG